MKTTRPLSRENKSDFTRLVQPGCLAAVLIALVSFSEGVALSQPQQNDLDEPGTQVLTRGPVHEAFAGIVTFNAEAGVIVTKSPPDLIEEMPPEERPEGENVTWIPGYWGWDDERSDFLWVSGTWRALPPGRAWMAGYWGNSPQGYQWTSGYWADAAVRETTYLPPPPATMEVGPNLAAPSVDYGWSPGCWIWYQGRYAWRPGYWALGRADWDWTPAHYVWSPRGYIFIGGFWDYPIARRGVLFAPVYLEAGVSARRGFFFSPRIAINLGVFSDHLFLRPRFHHYYFGDYYAPNYHQGGFYASFSFQSGRHGYDPIYSHQRWEHRQDRDWNRRVEVSYRDRRDHEAARPPRTWAAERTLNASTATPQPNRVVMATSINQLAKRKDGPLRFQPVAKEERQQLAKRGQEVQVSREQRRTLEAKSVDAPVRQPSEAIAPAKVSLPNSPIVGKPASQMRKAQAPPEAQRAPGPNAKIRPKPVAADRSPDNDRAISPAVARPPDVEKNPVPARSEEPSRGKQAPPEPVQRKPEPRSEAPDRSQRGASGPEKKAERITESRARVKPVPVEKGASKLLRKESKGKPSPPPNPALITKPQ